PVTSKVVSLGLAVSPFTPSTLPTVALMPLQQAPQQLCMPVKVRLLTLPLVAPLSSLMATSLLPVSPWNPAAARASSALWAAASSLAVIVTVLSSRLHAALAPSTLPTMSATVLTQAGQHRCTPFNSTLVSALAVPASTHAAARLANAINRDRIIASP